MTTVAWRRAAVAAFCAGLSVPAGAAMAQQQVSLSAGFVPDPYSVDVSSGGGNQASNMGSGCVGTIGESPDVTLYFDSAGGRLAIAVVSSGDTSLVINGPDGQFYCNDDTSGVNPALVWGSAPSGSYDIWVGAVGDPAPATLFFTEGSL